MRALVSSLIYLLFLLIVLSCNKEVDDGNIPPTANAGNDAFYLHPTNGIKINGSGTDADGQIVSYLWRKVSGPAGFNLLDPTIAQTTVELLEYGSYQLELKVVDNDGLFGVDTITFLVDSTAGDPCLGCWDY